MTYAITNDERAWLREQLEKMDRGEAFTEPDDKMEWFRGFLDLADRLEAERDHYSALGDDLDKLAVENVGLAGSIRLLEQGRNRARAALESILAAVETAAPPLSLERARQWQEVIVRECKRGLGE